MVMPPPSFTMSLVLFLVIIIGLVIALNKSCPKNYLPRSLTPWFNLSRLGFLEKAFVPASLLHSPDEWRIPGIVVTYGRKCPLLACSSFKMLLWVSWQPLCRVFNLSFRQSWMSVLFLVKLFFSTCWWWPSQSSMVHLKFWKCFSSLFWSMFFNNERTHTCFVSFLTSIFFCFLKPRWCQERAEFSVGLIRIIYSISQNISVTTLLYVLMGQYYGNETWVYFSIVNVQLV